MMKELRKRAVEIGPDWSDCSLLNSAADMLAEADALTWLAALADVYEHAQKVYELGLVIGVPKELARLPVPVARYSRMRASANLRNWLAFLSLRLPKNAQWEIRQFAQEVGGLFETQFPRTYALFMEAFPNG